jgi:hypothetical protein
VLQQNNIPGNFFYNSINPSSPNFTIYNSITQLTLIQSNSVGSPGSGNFKMVCNGSFIVDVPIFFDYSEFFMGKDASIIIKDGGVLGVGRCYLHSCSPDYLWDRIMIERGGYLAYGAQNLLEDAKIGIYALPLSRLSLGAANCFNKNQIGIQLEGEVDFVSSNLKSGAFTCIAGPLPGFQLYFSNLTYAATFLNPIASGVKSSIGILMKNFKPLGNSFQIGDTQFRPINPNSSVYFDNLDYGIKAFNTDFTIYNTDFKNIDDLANPLNIGKYEGSAIYIEGKTNVQSSQETWVAPTVKIGDIDDPNFPTIRFSNKFINCKRGVYEKLNTNIACKGNKFNEMSLTSVELNNNNGCILNVSDNTSNDFFQGFRLINCLTAKQFLVFNNTFSLTNSSLTSGKYFANTGIYMANSPIGTSKASITFNKFYDVRIGVYTNGISNSNITDNEVYFNRSFADLQNLNHVGFWTEGCSKSNYFNNTVTYSKLSSVPSGSLSTFKTVMRGFNIKGHTNSNFDYNFVNTCGTPMRLVGDVNQSFFSCNSFNGCVNGMLLQAANLSTQGTSSMSAGNKWINYNQNTLRIIGSLSSGGIREYFYSGNAVPSNVTFPSTNISINQLIFSLGGPSLCDQFFLRKDIDITDLDLVVLDSITIFDLTDREKERIAAFIAIDEFVSTNPNYVNWKGIMETTDVGMYARLTDSTAHRLDIANGLLGLNGFEDPVFQYKRDLFSKALINQYYATDSMRYDSISVDELANTNAWLGTSAVFLARALLEKEVDDEVNFLRLANNNDQQNSCDMSYTNYYDQLTLFSNEITTVDCYDMQGRLIEHFNFNYSKALSRNLLKDRNVFLLRMTTKDCSKTFRVQ